MQKFRCNSRCRLAEMDLRIRVLSRIKHNCVLNDDEQLSITGSSMSIIV